jgi:hypothetical protein
MDIKHVEFMVGLNPIGLFDDDDDDDDDDDEMPDDDLLLE